MGNLGYHQSALGSSGLRVLVASLVSALNLMIWPENALACECAPPPPPCVEYSETPIIFLGTVTEAIQTENGGVRLARMRIEKPYKGISQDIVILHDDGMCDGPTLQVGEQYLMYTHDDGTGYLPSRGCTRSRSVKYADEDLAFLNSLGSAAPTGTISGQATMSTGNLASTGNPLAGATIEILNEQEKVTTTTTDSNGRYSVLGLKPGAYVDLERGECEGRTVTTSSHNPKDYAGALRTGGFSRSAGSTQEGCADGASIGIPGEVEGAERYRNGVETGLWLTLGVWGCPKSALPKSAKYFEFLVSAAGFEPETHALKERTVRSLPRIFNNLRSRKSSQIGLEGWWSGLNRHVNKHRAKKVFTRYGALGLNPDFTAFHRSLSALIDALIFASSGISNPGSSTTCA